MQNVRLSKVNTGMLGVSGVVVIMMTQLSCQVEESREVFAEEIEFES